MRIKILILFSAFIFFTACDREDLYNYVKENSRTLKPDITTSLSSGALFNNDMFTVSIQAKPGAVIEYTINGSDPSPGTGTIYSGPFDIAAAGDNVIKAMAYMETEESGVVSIIVTVPSGTAGSPYGVSTAVQLNNIRGPYLNSHFSQTADIDLSPYSSGEGWLPIGNSTTNFTGSFNGNGLRITGLKIDRNTASDVGLFGQISGSVLAYIRLEGVNITGSINTGGLAGRAAGSSTITNSFTSGTVSGTGQTGGLVGNLFQSAIIESYSQVHVSGTGYYTGGLAGYSYDGSINRCFSAGNVTSTGDGTGGFIGGLAGNGLISQSFSKGDVTGANNTGGLAGSNENNSQIINCYATGNVSSSGTNIGGLVGHQYLTGAPSISKCYSTGMVTGTGLKGGLLGLLDTGMVSDSFWNTVTSTQALSAGSAIGRTTIEMKTLTTFNISWDFAAVWTIQEGVSYPYLQWQGTADIPY